MTAFDQYKAQLAGLPDDKFIGSVLWFTINRARITLDEMSQWFMELGLDERFLPNPPSPVNAFRNATGESHVSTCEYALAAEGQTAKLNFEEVHYDTEQVERQIVRMVRDRNLRTLDHTIIGKAKFFKPSKTAKRKGAGGHKVNFQVEWAKTESQAERKLVEEWIDRVHDEYLLLCQFPTANAVRATIRDYVQHLNAIGVRPSGGVYFVHKSRQETVNALVEFAARFKNGSQVHTLPLVDTGEQREMLADSFQDEVKTACERLLADVAKLNGEVGRGKVPPKDYAKFNSAYQDLMERAREYTDILQLGMGEAGAALEAALDSVMDLATRIDHKGT